jgi:hypothetical protein
MLAYLCHPFYLLLASPFAPKGQTSISKEDFALQLRPDRRFCFFASF